MKELIEKKKNNIGSLCYFLNQNNEYLKYVEDNIIANISEYNLSTPIKVYYYFNEIETPFLCNCGKHRKYIGFSNGFLKTCGESICIAESRKKTNIKRYGVDNPGKSKDIQNKSKKTIFKRYGGKHYMKDKEIQNKFKTTMKERYGVEYAQQNIDIKQKSLNTWYSKSEELRKEISENRANTLVNKTIQQKKLIEEKKNNTKIEKYGSLENYYKIIQDKIRKTSIEKYNVNHFFKSSEIIEKRVNGYINNHIKKIRDILGNKYELINVFTNTNKTDNYYNIKHLECGKISRFNRQFLLSRNSKEEVLCKICNPIIYGISKGEKEIVSFLKNYIDNIIENKKIENVEIDILLPKYNIGIEFNGLYWHSNHYKNKDYHLFKTKLCKNNGIQLLHIWEDQWLFKQDIVKSILLNKIGHISNKIYAKNCIIKEISCIESNNFLEENHLNSGVDSNVNVGLYYKNILVSLMGFKTKNYEMLRFCNILNTDVIGAASKLFNYFVNKYKVNNMVAYPSVDYNSGELYQSLGFELIDIVENYQFIEKRSLARFDIKPHRKHFIIYDSGNYYFKYSG